MSDIWRDKALHQITRVVEKEDYGIREEGLLEGILYALLYVGDAIREAGGTP